MLEQSRRALRSCAVQLLHSMSVGSYEARLRWTQPCMRCILGITTMVAHLVLAAAECTPVIATREVVHRLLWLCSAATLLGMRVLTRGMSHLLVAFGTSLALRWGALVPVLSSK